MTAELSSNHIQIESLEALPPDAALNGSLALIQGEPDSTPFVQVAQVAQDFKDIYFVKNSGTVDFSKVDGITRVTKFAASGFGLSTDDAFAITEYLTELKVLHLNNNRIAAAGLRAISEIEGLTSLHVANNGVGRGVASLSQLWQLTDLDISYNSLGGKKFLSLGELGNLERLRVNGCHIYAKNLHILGQLPKLRTLSVTDNNLGDDGAEFLAELTTLTKLAVAGNELTERGVAALKKLPNLTELNLD